jgi:hypothetical protein
MTVPTVSWDETSPAGSDNISAGDNRIRELKTQIREVVNVDHDFPSSGQDSGNGQHKQVTLQEQADIGSGATGKCVLGAQTVVEPELVYTNESDTDIQLTNEGKLSFSSITAVADMTQLMGLIYPIGSVITLGVSTNPATLLGVGTWTAITGKVIVGIAGSGTFDTLDATGGAETVDASHTHTVPASSAVWGATTAVEGKMNTSKQADLSDRSANTDAATSSGGSATQSTLQPYIVKYVWQRTA